jgi:membrane-bound metal-dependent hydrolase YbcI (DUF457 family)
VGVVSLIAEGPDIFGPADTILIPISLLSLLVLSVLVMGSLFLLRPVTFYLDGKKEEALRFLGATILAFAVIVFLFFAGAYAWNFAYPERETGETPDKGLID